MKITKLSLGKSFGNSIVASGCNCNCCCCCNFTIGSDDSLETSIAK